MNNADNSKQKISSISAKKPPCRLQVILARQAPVGVIFRRGPKKRVQIIRWNTDKDTFEPGQWLNGKIYPRRCDLSPNGELLIYFAIRPYKPTYTAISKLPWLTPLIRWPKDDCWDGGGLFLEDRVIWLNHSAKKSAPNKDLSSDYFHVVPKHNMGEDYPIYKKHLLRDGWILLKHGWIIDRKSWVEDWLLSDTWSSAPNISIFERAARERKQKLLFVYNYAEDEYFLVDEEKQVRLKIPEASWADWDQYGRLVFAKKGKLFAAEIDETGQFLTRELADFNANIPEPVVPPEWATHW